MADVSNGEPTTVVDERSFRTNFARRTAPSMFNSPAPCSSMLKPAKGCAVYIKIILMRLGVRLGFASSSTAAAPAATGAATEVPLRRIRFDFPGTERSLLLISNRLLGAALLITLF